MLQQALGAAQGLIGCTRVHTIEFRHFRVLTIAQYDLQVGPDAPPYANNTILSPHVYPTSIIPRGCTGKGLCNRLSNSWGHLQLKARLFRGV